MTEQKIKILCLADFHNTKSALRQLNDHLYKNKYDLVLCAGDIVSRPNKEALDYLKQFINIITKLHQTKLFLVHGNNETETMIDYLRRKKVLIHLQKKRYKGYKFFGISGWMEELPEISNLKSKISNAILLTHIPPKKIIKTQEHKNIKTKISDGPLIHLCGHIHSPGAIWRIGETLVVKIPSAMYGEAMVLEMPGRKVKFIKL